MTIKAESLKNRVLVDIECDGDYILEKRQEGTNEWARLVENHAFDGIIKEGEQKPREFIPLSKLKDLPTSKQVMELQEKTFIDDHTKEGIFQYRMCPVTTLDDCTSTTDDENYIYSYFVFCGEQGAIGYTFGNYHAPQGQWGQVVTADDLRYTYLWGTDFKAANGASYTDAQIDFFIKSATVAIGRELNIDIVKTCYRNTKQNPQPSLRREDILSTSINDQIKQDYTSGQQQGGVKTMEESLYEYQGHKVQKHGIIKTRHRPILELHKVKMIDNKGALVQDYLGDCEVNFLQGLLRLTTPHYRPADYNTWNNIAAATLPRGNNAFSGRLFYQIDYDTGYKNSDYVPDDLREVIAKQAAVSLLNIIGDGLMSGFSSSSLSMDGVSESFSSTQSATSAYFGARIKVYQDDIEKYIQNNRKHFASISMGCI